MLVAKHQNGVALLSFAKASHPQSVASKLGSDARNNGTDGRMYTDKQAEW